MSEGAAVLDFILSAAGESADITRLNAFLLFGMLGAVAHYVKKWMAGDIKGSLLRYCFKSHPRDTLASVLTFAGAAFSLHLGGQLAELTPQALIMLAFTTGYACDSALNRGEAD